MKLSAVSKSVLVLSVLSVSHYVFGAVSVTPSKVEGRMPAGKSYDNVFKVVNTEDKPASVSISWEDRTINPAKKDWFKLVDKSINIPVGGTVEVKYTIDIPEGGQGEYNAWIVFTGGSLGKIYGADLTTRLSIPVYIAVSGTQKYDFKIHKMRITNSSNNGTMFYIYVINTGNVHIRPTGTINITPIENATEKFVIPFNDIKWGIIPDEGMEYMAGFPKTSGSEKKKVIPNGKYNANIKIDVKGAEFSEKDNADMDVLKKQWEADVVFTVEGAKATIIEQKIKEPENEAVEKDNIEKDNK